MNFLDPNSAGKSTTIKMLTGLLAPARAAFRILGQDLAANSAEVEQIGVELEEHGSVRPPHRDQGSLRFIR